jgi:hypothetical protein
MKDTNKADEKKPEQQKDPKEAEKEAKMAEDSGKEAALDVKELTANKFLDKGDYQIHILIEEVRELKGSDDSE